MTWRLYWKGLWHGPYSLRIYRYLYVHWFANWVNIVILYLIKRSDTVCIYSVLIAKMGQDSTPPASPCHSTTRMEDNSLRTNNTDLVLRVKELQTEVQRLNRQLRLSNGGSGRARGGTSGMGNFYVEIVISSDAGISVLFLYDYN